MRRFDPKCSWESFWPLPDPLQMDRIAEFDPSWLAMRGIDPGAPAVLACLRDQVLPLVRKLESAKTLDWYSFLIHGYASGVPTTPDDRRNFVHFRFVTKRLVTPQLPPGWLFTQKRQLSTEIAGVQMAALATGDCDGAWRLIGAQSAWVLAFIEQHKNADMRDLIVHTKQFLHFFVNMTQMTAQ